MKKFLLVSMMALGLGTVAMANGNNGHRGFIGNQKYNSGKMSTRQ